MAQIYRRKYLLPSPDQPCTSIHHPPSDPVHIYRKYTAGPSPAGHAAHLLAGRLNHSYSEGSYHPLYPSIRCRIHLKHFQNFWKIEIVFIYAITDNNHFFKIWKIIHRNARQKFSCRNDDFRITVFKTVPYSLLHERFKQCSDDGTDFQGTEQ